MPLVLSTAITRCLDRQTGNASIYWGTPSTMNPLAFADRRRIGLMAEYSGESYHLRAASALSNVMTMMRFGGSPSRDCVLPPRTIYFPPYSAIVAGTPAA